MHMNAYLGYHLGRLAKVGTSLHAVGLGQVVLNQAESNVVAHPVQLLVDFHVVAIKVLAQLRNHGSICQRDQFRVDLVNATPGWW